MKALLIILQFSFLLSFNINDSNSANSYDSKHNKSLSSGNKLDNQILDKVIDENVYIVGVGDVFLFNMITTNGVITLELAVSPTGDVLIPIVGKVNLKGKILADAYRLIT